MKKTNKNTSFGMALGMCFGVSIGSALGTTLFNNIGTGMCIGMCIGMCLGLALGSAKDKEVNEQLESAGYTIKAITGPDEDKRYSVIIISRSGEEKTIPVDKAIMDEEQFKVGDVVYLDEDGYLEQAYEKE